MIVSELSEALRHFSDQLPAPAVPPFTSVQRRRRYVLLRRAGISGSTLAAVAVVVALTTGPSQHRQPSRIADTSPPATLTINGVTVHRAEPAAIQSIQAQNRQATTLLVIGGTQNPETPNQCQSWTDVRVLSESDTQVDIQATTYRDTRPQPPDTGCAAIGYPAGRFKLALAEPLAERTVVQSAVEQRVLLLDSLFHATTLPDGYTLADPIVGLESPDGLYLTTYRGPDQNTDIEIAEGARKQLGYEVRSLGHFTVRGHDGAFEQDGSFDDTRCLSWTERAGTVLSLCTRGNPAPLTGQQLASVAERLTVEN